MQLRGAAMAALACAVLLSAARADAVDKWVGVGPAGSVVKVLAVDPFTPSTLYAGTPEGVYRSPDGGATWSPTGLVQVDVNAIVIDPVHATTLYAATAGGAVLRTTDLAVHWDASVAGLPGSAVTALALTPTGALYAGTTAHGIYTATSWGAGWTAESTGITDPHIKSLLVDPATPDTLYAGTTTAGIFKTTDGGQTWTAANTGLTNLKVSALDLRPGSPATLLAGTGAGVFRSTDGGNSWKGSSTIINVRALVHHPTNALIVYAGTDTGGVFVSADGAATFSTSNSGLANRLVRALALDPADPATLYAGTAGGGFFVTSASATHWSASNDGLPGLAVTGIAMDPRAPQTVYAAVKGAGVFESSDAGTTWVQAVRGLGFFDMTALALDPLQTTTLYAGTTAGLYRTVNGGGQWTSIDTGLTSRQILALAVDPRSEGTLYVGTAHEGLFKSTDNGAHWIDTELSGTDVQCIAIDPAMPTTLYAGTTEGVQLSDDGGETWADTGLAANVEALAVDPASTVVYAGTASAGIDKAIGGASWQPMNAGLTSPAVAAIAVDPAHPGTLYAATTNGVFASTNAGGTWTAADQGFPIDPAGHPPSISAIAVDQTGTMLYVGTPDGVFRSGTPPSTTTTTTPSVTATTSAKPPASSCALGCDDGDPCTTDTCVRGICRHEGATGFVAVTCALEPAKLPVVPCRGVIPAPIGRRVERARSLIDQAAQTTPRRARMLLARTFRTLRAAHRLALAAGRRRRISQDCAAALAQLLNEAAARTRALVT